MPKNKKDTQRKRKQYKSSVNHLISPIRRSNRRNPGYNDVDNNNVSDTIFENSSNDDDSNCSEKTPNQTNNSTNNSEFIFRTSVTFFEVTLKVKPSTKSSEELRFRAATFLKIMQDTDYSVVILPYRQIANEVSEKGTVIKENKIIKSPEELPSTVTALGKYIF